MTDKSQSREPLKPCPFCGANPLQGLTKVYYDQLHGDSHQDFKIHCPQGCAQITRPDRERAAERWNSRALADQPTVELQHPIAEDFYGHAKDMLARHSDQPAVAGAAVDVGEWYQKVGMALLKNCRPMEAFSRCWNDAQTALRTATPSQQDAGAAGGDPVDDLITRFSEALLAKMRAAGKKYDYGNAWLENDWRETLKLRLQEHVVKGDPLDVAAYCAFAWHHSWSIAPTDTGGEEK